MVSLSLHFTTRRTARKLRVSWALDENRDAGVQVATLKNDLLSKSVYAVPLISAVIALPYLLLCALDNFAFSIPYVIGVFWFFIICPIVALTWLAKTIYFRVRTGVFSYPILKGIALLVTAYLIFGVGLFTFGCAVSA